MTDLPTLPKAAYSLDLNDGHPVVAYSVQQMYDFARAALAREQEAQTTCPDCHSEREREARDAARYRHLRDHYDIRFMICVQDLAMVDAKIDQLIEKGN